MLNCLHDFFDPDVYLMISVSGGKRTPNNDELLNNLKQIKIAYHLFILYVRDAHLEYPGD